MSSEVSKKWLKMFDIFHSEQALCTTSCFQLLETVVPENPSGCHNGHGGGSCCKPSNQCGEKEGDCDEDMDCFGNLKCGTNNCDASLGFTKSTDCCYDPKKL